MRIFLVTINTGTDFYDKAEQIIAEVGAESYSAQEEFWPDGVQDPYRAIDESDVVLWVEHLSPHIPLKVGDYNLLYGDTVLHRAVTSGKPVFYYQITEAGSSSSFPQTLQHISSKRFLESLSEIEPLLRTDLLELVASNSKSK
jgi:hypothetical protein